MSLLKFGLSVQFITTAISGKISTTLKRRPNSQTPGIIFILKSQARYLVASASDQKREPNERPRSCVVAPLLCDLKFKRGLQTSKCINDVDLQLNAAQQLNVCLPRKVYSIEDASVIPRMRETDCREPVSSRPPNTGLTYKSLNNCIM